MRNAGTRFAAAVTAGLLVLAAVPGAAWADSETSEPVISTSESDLPDNPEDWTPPSDWEVPDPSVDNPMPDPVNIPDPPTRTRPDCDAGWILTVKKKFPMRLKKVGPNFSSYFGNGGSQTLSSGISGTVTATVSAKIEGSLSYVSIVTAKAEISGSISTSATVTASDAETQNVKKGYWGNAYWGAAVLPITFHASYLTSKCVVVKSAKYTGWYPLNPASTVGWCKWISRESLGSRPKACNPGGYIPV